MALSIVKTNADLRLQVNTWISDNQIIAFVPTMGSLHEGHLHLISEAKKRANKVVCSIFVNPTQFNDPSDFERYPRNLDADINKLQHSECDLLYAPSVEEVYDGSFDTNAQMSFGNLETVMEGKHRPGHFNGVGVVVKRLFELVTPHMALFGLKDYQQFCIINKLVELYQLPVKIIGIDTVRDASGLAKSSRNVLLDELHSQLAPTIYAALTEAQAKINQLPLNHIKLLVEQRLLALPDVRLDYVEIADAQTLETISSLSPQTKARIFIAAFFGKIRLIDNLELN